MDPDQKIHNVGKAVSELSNYSRKSSQNSSNDPSVVSKKFAFNSDQITNKNYFKNKEHITPRKGRSKQFLKDTKSLTVS